MNRAYRFVWSKAKGCWDIASEITKGNGGPRTAGAVIARHSLLSAAILFAPLSAWAGPAGEQVVAGVASISRPDARTTWISQQSDKAIINWNSFSIAGPELVRFQQPGAGSIALNRVTGPDPSQIFGQLQANGQIFLVNPNGVLFAPGSQVSVHGLLATTHNIANDDFLAGRYSFSRLEGLPDAEVINQGLLEAAEGGYIVLAGDYAANTGVIQARLGQVALASGNRFTLDLEGDQLIGLAVDEASLARRAGVENFGELSADGGRVLMTARVAGELTSAVVNNEGLIRARTIEERNGEILLLGGMENGRFTEQNTVRVGGTLDASAPDGGDGGFVETSAYHLEFDNPVVTAAAPYGKGGEWLIDPNNITIQATGPDSNLSGNPDFTTTADSAIITTATVESALNAGTSVTITTGTSGGDSQEGNITVSSAISKSNGSDATLTLSAHNNIDVNAAISSTSNKLYVTLNADSDTSGVGSLAMNAGSSIISNGGSINLKGVSIGSSGNPFRLSPGSVTGLGTVTATATATTGGGIYLEQMSGDAYSSKYIFNVPGGGQVIDLYTTDGNMIFDSLLSDPNVSNDFITLTTAGTSKNITFNNGINFYAAGLTMNGTGSVNFEAGTVTLNTPVTANLPVNIASGNTLTLIGSGTFTSSLILGTDAALTAKGTLALAASPALGARAKVGITTSGPGILTVDGQAYTVINSLGAAADKDSSGNYTLQGMAHNLMLSGYYALGSDIVANESGNNTADWNSGAGFLPIGNDAYIAAFTGAFDGLGHTITGLTINRPNTDYVGLFGSASGGPLRNVGLEGGSVTGNYHVGGLVGYAGYSTISDSHATGSVTGDQNVGGLVGNVGYSTISDSYATGSVSGNRYVGGLIGSAAYYINNNIIINSHYNIDASLINGAKYVTLGGLYSEQFQDWLGNGKTLDITGYFGALVDGYYQIGDLQGMKDLLGFAADPAYRFRLTADLDLASASGLFIPYLGATEFDGADHTISNLFINQPFNGYVGLFGRIETGSTISNLGVVGVNVIGGDWAVGGLAGENSGTISNAYSTGSVLGIGETFGVGGLVGSNKGDISDAYATGEVTVGNGGGEAGGLVGYNYSGSISNSHATGAVTVGNNGGEAGGLVGYNGGDISNSYATGAVTIGLDSWAIGGLVGWDYGSISNSYAAGTVTVGIDSWEVGGLVGEASYNTISNAYATGSVTGGYSYVGGLVGKAYSSTISDSYATGSVTGVEYVGGLVGAAGYSAISNSYATGSVTGTNYVGGLVGYSYGGGSITASYWDTETSGQASSAGGTGLTTDQMKQQASFDDWDFTEIWGIDAGSSSPYLLANEQTPHPAPFSVPRFYWDGGSDNDLWSSVANWSTDALPDTGSAVTIGSVYGTILFDLSSLSLTSLDTASAFTIQAGNSLTLTKSGTFTNTLNTLSLGAGAALTAKGTLALAASPTLGAGAKVGITTSGADILTIGGELYTVINSLGSTTALGLQEMNGGLSGKYALGSDIDASGTSGWNSEAGFVPVGNITTPFTGTLDGLGHTITGLTINRPDTSNVGLFGYSLGRIQNIGLTNLAINGSYFVGGLAGVNYGTISNSHALGTISGSFNVGGLVGANFGSGIISDSYAGGSVSATMHVGGLVGRVGGTILNSHYNINTTSLSVGGEMLSAQFVSVGGLYNTQYEAWIGNGKSLTIENYFSLSNGYYGIETTQNLQDLLGFADNSSYSFRLVADLDLSTIPGWHIPYFAAAVFDGSGHTLSNLKLAQTFQDKAGLIGELRSGSIITNLGLLNVDVRAYAETGGLVGSSYGTISNSYVTGTVSGSEYAVGGLVGRNQPGSAISGSYATATVSGNTQVGGLVGDNYNYSTISNSYAIGAVSEGTQVGGLVGKNSGTITASYWNTETSGQTSSAGGTGLTTTQMKAAANFSDWDLMDTWRIYEGYTYPLLKSFLTPLVVTAEDVIKTYNGLNWTTSLQNVSYSIASAPDSENLFNIDTPYGTAVNAAVYSPQLYSNQQGYDISFVGGILTVGKAPLTITAENQNKIYGAPDPSLTATYSGFQSTDNATVISGLNLNTATGAEATAGFHTITAADATAANYQISYTTGILTVDKAALTITADDKTKVYGATDPTLTASYGTFYYDDTSAVVSGLGLSTATGSSATAGTHTITAANATADNYQISYTTGILTVDKAALTITADDKAKVYGAADPTLTASYGTLFYGDTSAVISGLNLSTATGAAATAGNHTITAANATAANYTITHQDGTLTVDKAALTITADDKAKVYGAADPTLTASYGTFYYGDDASVISGLSLSTATGAAAIAGMHTITAADATAANYQISYTTGILTVDKAALTITADNKAKVYGAADPTLTASYGTFYYGDTSAVVSGLNLSTATGAEATAGMHTITASNATAANYQISYTDGTLTVDKAALIITADNKAKVYGATGPTLTASYGTFSYSDDASVVSGLSLNTATDADATAGNHAITAANATAANYQISYTDGTLTVDKAALTITADNQSKIYGATDPTPTASYSTFYYDDDASVISGLNLSTVTGAEATAGTHTITAANASAANYTITHQDGTLTVDRRVVNAALNGEVGKIYDGTVIATLGNNYTLDIISGDSVVLAATGSYDTRHVGTNKSVDFTGLSLSGDDAGNYLLQTATLSGNIGVIRQLSSVTWTGGATGNWSAAANWAGGALPDGGNVAAVSIPANTAVTFDAATAITGLDTLNVETGGSLILAGSTLDIATSLTTPIYSQTGGTLSGAGSLNVSNSFSKTGGSLALSGPLNIIQAEGNLSFSNPVPVFLGAITVNAGNIAIEATGGLTTGSSLVAAPSGTISLTALSPLTIGSGGVLAANGVSLTAGSGNGELVVNGAVVSSNGPITMTGDSIAQNADINAGSGSVSATANSGSIILASNVTTTGGSISYTASGPINYSSAGQFVGPTPSLFANTADQTQAPQSVLSETSQAVLATVTDLVQQDTIIPAAVADEPAAPTQTASSTQTEEEQKKKEETAEVIENQSQTPLQTKPIFDLASGGVAGQQMVCK